MLVWASEHLESCPIVWRWWLWIAWTSPKEHRRTLRPHGTRCGIWRTTWWPIVFKWAKDSKYRLLWFFRTCDRWRRACWHVPIALHRPPRCIAGRLRTRIVLHLATNAKWRRLSRNVFRTWPLWHCCRRLHLRRARNLPMPCRRARNLGPWAPFPAICPAAAFSLAWSSNFIGLPSVYRWGSVTIDMNPMTPIVCEIYGFFGFVLVFPMVLLSSWEWGFSFFSFFGFLNVHKPKH